jgi:nucleoside-diphosphate-sugar epimerase
MILVTGATGTIGLEVVKRLLDMGADIRAGVHSRPLDLADVETRTIDYDQPETLPPTLEGVQAMFEEAFVAMQLFNSAPVAAARCQVCTDPGLSGCTRWP